MDFLAQTLIDHGYIKIRFKLTRTNHLLIPASINGVKGQFILDTGASNTCVGFESAERFGLKSRKSKTLAAGAGATGMETRLSRQNTVRVGRWVRSDMPVVIFDLSHVNAALVEHKVKPVDGIIGADVLLIGHAIIDYYNHVLFLKH